MPDPRRQRMGALSGLRAVLTGARRFFRDPAMRRQLVIGLLISTVAFVAVLVGLIWGAVALTAGLVDVTWLGWIVRIGVIVGLVIISPVVFALLRDVLLPTVHGTIFDRAREQAGGPPIEAQGGVAREVKTIGVDLRRLAGFLAKSALLLLVNVIPGVGSVAYVALQAGLTAHTMGWDLLAYHFEVHGLSLAEQKAFLKRNRGLTLAVGAVAEVMMLVPIVQLILAPATVAGAGVLSARLDGADEG